MRISRDQLNDFVPATSPQREKQTSQQLFEVPRKVMDPACSSTRRASPCSPAFRHQLAIAIAADSESAAPPRETTGSPNSALREELTVASADALHDSSTGSARMNVPVSRCCSSGGSAYSPPSPRGRSDERLRCVPEIDETLDSAGSFYTSAFFEP